MEGTLSISFIYFSCVSRGIKPERSPEPGYEEYKSPGDEVDAL
jgi:hypothetical protein